MIIASTRSMTFAALWVHVRSAQAALAFRPSSVHSAGLFRSRAMQRTKSARSPGAHWRTLTLIPLFENLFRRHALDPFLQKQAPRGEIGERQGDREFCFWVKSCLPQSFHNLIDVPMVGGVNLANQAMASTLSAEKRSPECERPQELRYPARHPWREPQAPNQRRSGRSVPMSRLRCFLQAQWSQGYDEA